MKTALIAAILLSGCGLAHTTVCGLRAGGDFFTHEPGFFTPEVMQEAEWAADQAMRKTADPRLYTPGAMCKSLQNISVFSMPTINFDSYNRRVSGITQCQNTTTNTNYIVVGTPADGDWRHSSLVHELVHVAQLCTPRGPNTDPGRDADHANWDADGIQAAIEEANSP